MIGGAFLMTAIMAIFVITMWADKYDDYPDDASRPSPLGLKDVPRDPNSMTSRAVRQPRSTNRQPRQKWKPRRLDIDHFDEIEDEISRNQGPYR